MEEEYTASSGVAKVESSDSFIQPHSSVDEQALSDEEDAELMELLDDDAIDPTLAFPDPEQLNDELRARIKKSTVKLKKLFRKAKTQYDEVVENAAQQASTVKTRKVTVITTDTDKQKISGLNKRIRDLKEKIEISDSKARSLTVQRVADKKRYEDIIRENEITIGAMNQKIMMMESKRRYQEQVSRDPNNMVEMLTPMEIEELKNSLAAAEARVIVLEEDLVAKRQVIDKYTTEMATAQYNLATSERTISKLESRVDDMIKKEIYQQEKANEAVKQVEERTAEVQKELSAERSESDAKSKQIDFLKTKKTEMEGVVAKAEAEKKSLKFKCDGLEANEDGLKKEIDALRGRQRVDKEELVRLKGVMQDKLKAAAEARENLEQENDIRLENMRGKMEAIDEKLKAKTTRTHELEKEVDEVSAKLLEEKAQNEQLRLQLANALKAAPPGAKSKKGSSQSVTKEDFVDDGTSVASCADDDASHHRFTGNLVEGCTQTGEEGAEAHFANPPIYARKHAGDNSSDEEFSPSLTSATSGIKSKKHKQVKGGKVPKSAGNHRATPPTTARSAISSRQSETPAHGNDKESDLDQAALDAEEHVGNVRPKKLSSKKTAAVKAAASGKPPKSSKVATTKQRTTSAKGLHSSSDICREENTATEGIATASATPTASIFTESSVEDMRTDDASSVKDTARSSAAGSITAASSTVGTAAVAEADLVSDLEGSDDEFISEEEEEEEEEEAKEILIRPFPEERMLKLLKELNAEPTNMTAALKFCGILERSTRMSLQDSLNDQKDPNLAHEQTTLAALKLARDLFTQARKYSLEKLQQVEAKASQEVAKARKQSNPYSTGRPNSAGASSTTIVDSQFDKFRKEAKDETNLEKVGMKEEKIQFDFGTTDEMAEFVEAKRMLAEQDDDIAEIDVPSHLIPNELDTAEVAALKNKILSLEHQMKGIRRSTMTVRSNPAEEAAAAAKAKKKAAVIVRQRRNTDAAQGTGKLFRTFYRAKSTVEVDEEEDRLCFRESAEFNDEEDAVVEQAGAIIERDSFDQDDNEVDFLEYEILDDCLEEVAFPRGITVGANEIILLPEQFGSEGAELGEVPVVLNSLVSGRFGAIDLVKLTVTERKIMTLEYLVAKCKKIASGHMDGKGLSLSENKIQFDSYEKLLAYHREEFDDGQIAIIPRMYPADKLARLLASIDKEVTLLSVMYCWFRIKLRRFQGATKDYEAKKENLRELGLKLAAFNLHRHVIEVCLDAAGGWDTALTFLARREDILPAELKIFPESKQIKLLHVRVEAAEKLAAKAKAFYSSSKETQRQLQDLVAVERRFAKQEKRIAQEEIANLREALAAVSSNAPPQQTVVTTDDPEAKGESHDSFDFSNLEIAIPQIVSRGPSFAPSPFRSSLSISLFDEKSVLDGVALHDTIKDVNLVSSSFMALASSRNGSFMSSNFARNGTPPVSSRRPKGELIAMPPPSAKALSLAYLTIPIKMIGQSTSSADGRLLAKELMKALTFWLDGHYDNAMLSLKECLTLCPLPEESTVEHDVVDALLDLVDAQYSTTTEIMALKEALKIATLGDDELNEDGSPKKRLVGLKLTSATSLKDKKGNPRISKLLKSAVTPVDFIAKLKEKMNSKFIFGEFQREHAQSRYHAAVVAMNKAAAAGDSDAYADAQAKLLRAQVLLLQKHVNNATAANDQRARYAESSSQTAAEDLLVDGSGLELAQKDETLAAHKEPAGFYIVQVSSGGYACPGIDATKDPLLACDTGLELCTGITLASIIDLRQTLFNMMFDENGGSLGVNANPEEYTWLEITRSFEDIPAGVALAYKAARHSFHKGVREWLHGPSEFPILRALLPKTIRMVVLPRLLQISPDVCMVPGIDLGPSVKLPVDCWAIQGAFSPNRAKSALPSCMTVVRLSPQLRASRALMDLLDGTVEMMQMKSAGSTESESLVKAVTLDGPAAADSTDASSAPPAPKGPVAPTMLPLSFPVNYEFAPGVKGAPFPDLLKEAIINAAEESGMAWSMPPGAQFVSRTPGTSIPNCLCPILGPDSKLSEDMSAADQIALSCTVLKTPHGVDLPEGCVLVVRPISAHNGMTIPLPSGMDFVPDEEFPSGLSLAEGINLVKLRPRYDFPANTIISPDVSIRMCPLGVHLPENVQLINRKPGTKLPPGVQSMPLPAVPKGCHIPANVEAIRFLRGTNLASGAYLGPGLEIVSFDSLGEKSVVMPPGIVLVRRQANSLLPPGTVRGLKQDLPTGTLLPSGIEVIRILPRFELPQGVQLAAGAVLPCFVDLPAGTRVGNGYRVERCPQGMFLPAGMTLLGRDRADAQDSLDWDVAHLPNGFEKVTTFKLEDALRASQYTNQAVYVPLKTTIAGLPHALHLPSGLQIAETITLLDVTELDPPLFPGLVMIKRPRHNELPSELYQLPPSKILSKWEVPEGGEIVGVNPVYEWPSGVELMCGYEVIFKPPDFAVPFNMCLLRPMSGNAQMVKDPIKLNKLGVHVINPKKISTVISNTIDKLPDKGCILAYLDSTKVRVKSWGPSAPGIQVVEKMAQFLLPSECFLIICNHNSEIPSFLKKTPKDFFVGSEVIPPGVDVVQLAPRYFLPRGIGGISRGTLPVSIELSPGEWLGPGVVAAAMSSEIRAKIPEGVHAGFCLDSRSNTFDVSAVRTPAGFELIPTPAALVELVDEAVDYSEATGISASSKQPPKPAPKLKGVLFLELKTEISPLQHRIPTMNETLHSFNSRRGLAPKLNPINKLRPDSKNGPDGVDEPVGVLAAAAETAPPFVHPIVVPPGEISFARPGGPAAPVGKSSAVKPSVKFAEEEAMTKEVESPSKRVLRTQITFDEGISEPQALVELREENLALRDGNNKLAGEIVVWTTKHNKALEELVQRQDKNAELNKALASATKENAKQAVKFNLKKDELLDTIDDLKATIKNLQNNVDDLVADLDHEKLARESESQIATNPRLAAMLESEVDIRTQQAIQESLGHVRAQLLESFISTMVPQIVGSACTLVSEFIDINEKVHKAFSQMAQEKSYVQVSHGPQKEAGLPFDNAFAPEDSCSTMQIEAVESLRRQGYGTAHDPFTDEDRPNSKGRSIRGRSGQGSRPASKVGIKVSHIVDPSTGVEGGSSIDGAASVSEVQDNIQLYTVDSTAPPVLESPPINVVQIVPEEKSKMYHLKSNPVTLLDQGMLRVTGDPRAIDKPWARDLVMEIDAKMKGHGVDGNAPGIYTVDGRILHAAKPLYNIEAAVEQLMGHIIACVNWDRISNSSSSNLSETVDFYALQSTLNSWRQGTLSALVKYYEDISFCYCVSFKLMEKELDVAIKKTKDVTKRLQQTTEIVTVLAGANGGTVEGFVHREEDLKSRVLALQSELDMIRTRSSVGTIQRLQHLVNSCKELGEQEKRLELSALVSKRQYRKEEEELAQISAAMDLKISKADLEELEWEQKAIVHQMKVITKRTASMLNRAFACKEERDQVIAFIHHEIASFHRVVQGVVPSQTLSQLSSVSNPLQHGITKRITGHVDVVPSSTMSVGSVGSKFSQGSDPAFFSSSTTGARARVSVFPRPPRDKTLEPINFENSGSKKKDASTFDSKLFRLSSSFEGDLHSMSGASADRNGVGRRPSLSQIKSSNTFVDSRKFQKK